MDGLDSIESWTSFAELIIDAKQKFIPQSKARNDTDKLYSAISE